MKLRNLLYTSSVVVILSSCMVTSSFYQVYDVKPINETITKSDLLFFEDENCIITYDLWAKGGDIGFDFYNKSDNKIYVKLNESNFIVNGYAYDYFKNRTFTTSESKSASTSKMSTSSVGVTGVNTNNYIQTNQVKGSSSANLSAAVGYSVSMKEDSIVCIPPKTTKRISEYSINEALIRNCDLFKYPRKKEITTMSYSEDESPIVFGNRITYEIEGNSKVVTNEFYVSQITNYPESDFFETKYKEFCGQTSDYRTKYFKYDDADKFYIKYNKGTDYWRH